MKITFEGKTFNEVLDQMEDMLSGVAWGEMPAKDFLRKMSAKPNTTAVEVKGNNWVPVDNVPEAIAPEAIVPEAIVPVDKPVEKRERTEKQKANDARLRERALAKKAAGLKPFEKAPKAAPAPEPTPPPPPASAESLGLAPDEVVKLRQRTIEELQAAYANGHQAEVFELLSRFGNGAKSFRELPVEAFVPIREAIDNGALT